MIAKPTLCYYLTIKVKYFSKIHLYPIITSPVEDGAYFEGLGSLKDDLGGNTPLPINGDNCSDLEESRRFKLFVGNTSSFLTFSPSSRGCGTDLALTSFKFSTTKPISGPARYLVGMIK